MESKRAELLVHVMLAVTLPFVLGSSLLIFNDGDVRWHIAAGQWMLKHGALPSADPFSFSFAGAKWVTFEWLSQLLFGGAYRFAGFGGVAAVTSLALVALHLIVAGHARRHVGPWGVAAAIVLMDLALIPMMLARPHLLAWPFLALWLAILLRARDADRVPPLPAALLIVPWANLHGSWAIGIAIAGFVALDHVLERNWDPKLVGRWLMFGVLAMSAALLTPNGIDAFLHPLAVSKMKTLPLVMEWRSSSFERTPNFFLAVALTVALIAWRGIRLRPVMALLLVLLTALALHQMRHQAMLAISAALILPLAMGKHGVRAPLFAAHQRRLAIAGLVVAVLGLATFRAARPLEPAENGANPRTAMAALPTELRNAPGLNGYGFGGPLILSGIKVFIDGRQDMYGDAFVSDYQRMVDGDRAALDSAVRSYGLEWTMLPPRYDRLVANLDSDPNWQRIHADKVAIIHRRIHH